MKNANRKNGAGQLLRRMYRWSTLLVLAALVLSACQRDQLGNVAGKSSGLTGGITAHLVWPESGGFATSSLKTFGTAPIPTGVEWIRLIVQDPALGFADIEQDFDVDIQRSGVIKGVPAGINRTLIIRALNGDKTVVYYEGTQTGITVTAGTTNQLGDVPMALVSNPYGGALTISNVVPSPYYSNATVLSGGNLSVTGACTSTLDHTVRARLGDSTGPIQGTPVACASGSYTLQLPSPEDDGTYSYTFEQLAGFGVSVTASLTWTWVLDTSAPSAVSLTDSDIWSGSSTVTVTGTCETGATVGITPDGGGTTVTGACASSAFSIDITTAGNGDYDYDVEQEDGAGNLSTAATLSLHISNTIPATPTISVPSTSSTSSQDALGGMTFTCTTAEDHTIQVQEDGIQIVGQACSGSPQAVTFSGTTDTGSHTYRVRQVRDLTSVASAWASITWIIDTSAPSAPSIISPVAVASGGTHTGPLVTNELTITITGACETGATVTRSGGTTADDSVTCSSGSYNLDAEGDDETEYAITISQTDAAENESGVTTLNWMPSATVPETPVIDSPSTNPFYANSLTTISGTCTDGLTVNLTGDATASMTCGAVLADTFSFTITSPTPDDTYTYSVTQSDIKTSAAAVLEFHRDTAVSTPTVTTPATSTVTNGLSAITISGTCEANGTVNFTGAVTQSPTCTSGGTFSITDNQTDDGTYVYTIGQTDLAGNESGTTDITWNRQTNPPAPVITLPAAATFYSNTLLTTISGTCVTGLTVSLSGDATDSTTCTAGEFDLAVSDPGTDGTYDYEVIQTNTTTSLSSTADTLTWVYDTGVPAVTGLDAAVITSNDGSINIEGTCETGTTVYLTDVTGAGVGNQSQLCVAGEFSFTVSQSTTGVFLYEVTQTDAAGNTSSAANQQWNRPAPGYTVSPQTSLAVSETGTSADFTVVLQSVPNGNVVVDVVSSDTTEGTVSGVTLSSGKLTFNAGNWNTAQTVTVTGVDEATADGNQVFQITLTTDTVGTTDTTGYDAINPGDVQVTNSDDDAPGVTVTPTSGLLVNESGIEAQFGVVLNTAPNGDVVINVTSQDLSEITLDIATLTFNAGNWDTIQYVTLTGEDDAIDDGNQLVTIQVTLDTVLTTDTTGYDAINPADVTATNSDDDAAGFTVSPTTGLVTSEGGSSTSFTVSLNTSPNPGEVVVINVVSQDTTEVTVDKATLTFTPSDYFTPQTVTLTGVDDVSVDGNQSTTIALTINTGLTTDTTGYDALNPPDPAVINSDNDVANVTVTPTVLTVSENGSEAEFSVRLNTQPSGPVVILVQNGDSTELTVDKTDLTFTAGDWLTPQYVRVTGKSDASADGNILVNVALIIDTTNTTDANYDVVDPADVSVTNLDNTDAVTVTPTSGLQTTDLGGTAQFTVVLNTQPDTSALVVIDVASLDTDEVTTNVSTLTFDDGNWNTPQTVTLTGQASSGGSQIVTIQLTMSGSTTDTGYAAINPADVTVTNIHSGVYEVIVTPLAGHTTSENGGSSSFNVSITSPPSDDVVVSIVSNDTTEVTVDKSTLTFTSADWNTTQVVTMKGVNDTLTDGSLATTVTVSTSSADPNYTGIADETVNVTNTDNEPGAEGSIGSPVVLNGEIPYDGTVPSSSTGSSYFVITGLIPTTQSYYISISSLVNPATLYVYTTSNFSTTLSCTGNQNPTSSRPKSCFSNANSSGELYIQVTSNSSSAGATFKLDVVTAPVNEGATGTGNQIELTYAGLPFDLGQVGTGTSYYRITGVPASVNKLVRVLNMTDDVNLDVYSNDTFGTLLCAPSDSGIAEACIAAVPANGELYVAVDYDGSGSGATFELDIVDPPVNQGADDSPLDITGQLPYAGTMLGSPGSFYVISGLTPGTTYTVALTEVTNGIGLIVYSDASFSTELCASADVGGGVPHGLNAPESCQAAANSSGRLYVFADPSELSSADGTTYNIRIQ